MDCNRLLGKAYLLSTLILHFFFFFKPFLGKFCITKTLIDLLISDTISQRKITSIDTLLFQGTSVIQ